MTCNRNIPNSLFRFKIVSLGFAVLLTTLFCSTFAQSAEAALKDARGRIGRCSSGSNQWLIPYNCYFPLETSTSYINLSRFTNTGGSGADVWFCDGNTGAQPNSNYGKGCYKYTVHVNQYALNPLGVNRPTDIYIWIHNSNWYTDFRLN